MPEPGTDLKSQVCSPAQTDRSECGERAKSPWGERASQLAAGSELNVGAQAADSNEVSKSASLLAPHSERRSEQDNKCEAADAQPLRASQWLKSILPEATNGWWDLRDKGAGVTIKFRWRDPNLQVITLLSVASEQFETLKESPYENAKSMIREKISLRLQSISLDPVRRDKALIAARKLGIDLD